MSGEGGISLQDVKKARVRASARPCSKERGIPTQGARQAALP